MTDHIAPPRFVRIWHGETAREKSDDYQDYWLENGVSVLKARGALQVEMLREDVGDITHFVTLSYWHSLDDMTGNGDADASRPHHLPRDREFLLALPERVQVLTVLQSG